jgi:hypothetical protein
MKSVQQREFVVATFDQRFELRVRLRLMRATLETVIDALHSDNEPQAKKYLEYLAQESQQAVSVARELKLVE